ncbi:MAG: DUF4397 domain-containing protein [Gemmatimonadota bacterium]|nr:DUF4397 domain-containing protein [Gemmatimonadota bacterium]
MIKFRTIALILSAFALAACEKNAVQDITGTVPGSRIKFFNFGVNAPSVNFYANDAKVTAVLSTVGTELNTGTAYGSVGSGGFYSGLNPGTYALKARLSDTASSATVLASVSQTLAEGKNYSYYTSGFYDATAKTTDAFVLEDNLTATIDFTAAYVRFVNAISNSQPMILYARDTLSRAEVPLGAAIAYKSGGTFVSLPPGIYDLNARLAGSTTNVISRLAVQFVAGRVYTIGALGDITVTSSTAPTRARLDNTANR